MTNSPLSRADDAKRRRDLADEISILRGTHADPESQPWYPLVAGDVVLISGEGGLGETYLAEPDDLGEMTLRRVSADYDDGRPADWQITFCDLWFEASPDALTVIRAGAVVYGVPATMPGDDAEGDAQS